MITYESITFVCDYCQDAVTVRNKDYAQAVAWAMGKGWTMRLAERKCPKCRKIRARCRR